MSLLTHNAIAIWGRSVLLEGIKAIISLKITIKLKIICNNQEVEEANGMGGDVSIWNSWPLRAESQNQVLYEVNKSREGNAYNI